MPSRQVQFSFADFKARMLMLCHTPLSATHVSFAEAIGALLQAKEMASRIDYDCHRESLSFLKDEAATE